MYSRSDLRSYQARLADFIQATPKCAVWVDMRLGKTVSTLTAVSDLILSCDVRRVLVVAPDFVVSEQVWPSEIERWAHLRHLSCHTICGPRPKRHSALIAALKAGVEVYVITYSLLLWLVALLHSKWPFDVLVIDEASAFKDASTKRFAALSYLTEQMDRVIELTGTPTSSGGLLNIWPQIYLLDQGRRLGTTFDSYQKRFFCSDYGGYKWTPFAESEQDIYNRVGDLVFRLDAADHLDLPEVLHVETRVELPASLRKIYRELEREFLLEFDDAPDIEAASAGVLANKLLQFCQGAVYDEAGNARHFHDLKLDALAQIVEGTGDNLLVAFSYQFDLANIKRRFPFAVHVKEADAIKRWNRGEVRMLVTHPGSVAYGLDLYHGGHTFVWYGLNWSLELTQQFEARLKHPSQPTIIGHRIVVADSRDEDVLAGLAESGGTQRGLFEAMKRNMEMRVR